MIQVNCPCCESYMYVNSDSKLEELRRRRYGRGTEIVCDDCWRVFMQIIKRRLRQRRS